MKKVIKPEEAQYICDICGEEIACGPYDTDLVKITFNNLKGNGWNEWFEKQVYHCHKKCIGTTLDLIRKNKIGGL